MQHELFIALSLIIAIAVVVSAIMRLFRQPLIIGYILTGVLIGPTFFRLLPDSSFFEELGSFGVTLLLFINGLGLNFAIIRRLGKVVLVTAVMQIAVVALIGYTVAAALGLTPIQALVLGFALTLSSTIITVKILNDKREQTRLYGQIAIGILLVQDIIASIALVWLATSQNGGVPTSELIGLLIKGGGAAAVLGITSSIIMPRIAKFVASSQEFLFLFALGWGFGIASLFEVLGFSIEVGALFAGVSLAWLPYSQEITSRLKPLRDFFVVLFFIVLGAGLQFGNFAGALLPAVLFALIVVICKPLVVLAVMGFMGYTKRISFKTALTLGQVSEFSLIFLILAETKGLVPAELGSVITITALITIAASTYLMKYDDRLFAFFERSLHIFERKTVRTEQQFLHRYPVVLFGYRKGGVEFVKSFRAIHKRFVVVDYNPEVVEHLQQQRIDFVYGDATDFELLQEVGIESAKLIVSTIADHPTNLNLVKHVASVNPAAIIVCHSERYEEAAQLYHAGATYVMLPHLIGSERIGSFIKRKGLNKKEFLTYRDKHLMLLESQPKSQQ